MKITLTILLVLLSTMLFGQNKYWSLGSKKLGVCIGNPVKYNGIKLNLWEKDSTYTKFNGLNIAAVTGSKKSNGISIGIFASIDSFSNGLKIGGTVTVLGLHSGIALSLIQLGGKKYNGITASLGILADTINGIAIALIGISNKDGEDIALINGIATSIVGIYAKQINGLAISGFKNDFEQQNGVAIACYNRAKELSGFQFGLLNYAGNNSRLFRWLPFINCHFGKKKAQKNRPNEN